MPVRKIISTSAYSDVQSVLDTVLRSGQFPARYTLLEHKAAIRWRHRANQLRAALRNNEEITLGLLPGSGTSQYDHLVFRIDGQRVIIDMRAPEGVLEVGGQIVEPEPEEDLFPDLPEVED